MANEKIVKKRGRSTKHIPCKEGLTVEEALLTTENRFTVATTTVWSGLGYLFSKDAVKILTKEEVEK
jgi:hypothetical protein